MTTKESNGRQKWVLFIKSQKSNHDLFFWNRFLKRTKFISEADGVVLVSVPDASVKQAWKAEGLSEEFGRSTKLKLKFVIEATKKPVAKIAADKVEFKNFVVGDFNRAAFQAAQLIVAGENEWNVFFIHSEPGLGKTFLLQSLAEKIGSRAEYLNGSDFGGSFFTYSAKKNKGELIQNWKNQISEKDVFLLDDIHILSDRKKTQSVLAEITNKFIEGGKTLVFACDQPPESLVGFERRLVSRLHSGLILKVGYPDSAAAREIVLNKVEETKNLKDRLRPTAVQKIADSYSRDLRQMNGVIKRLDFFCTTNKDERIDDQFVTSFLAGSEPKTQSEVSLPKIKGVVARQYSLPYSSISSKSRRKEVVEARYVAFYLARELTTKSHAVIARSFNAKSHTTVVNAIKRVQREFKRKRGFRTQIELIKKQCLDPQT